MSQCKYL